jgi:hypothetical protein
MEQAGDFEAGLGIGEVVEVVDPGGVLEAEAGLNGHGGEARRRAVPLPGSGVWRAQSGDRMEGDAQSVFAGRS